MAHIRWGILGAAKFAREHMGPAIHAARGAQLAAIATSDPAKAEGFRDFAPAIRLHSSYDALLDDPDIDAVYIPLPNHLHVAWTLRALAAGKHVLCEKPMAMQAEEYAALIAARDATGLVAAEAFMIVHHPQFIRARALLAAGAIGDLRHVSATFTYNNGGDVRNIRNRPETGGGALRDIGVYTCGAVRFVTGQDAQAITYAQIAMENGVDVFAQYAARFDGFSYDAVVSMRMHPQQEISFHGDRGLIRLTCPFNANLFDLSQLVLETDNHSRTIERWPAVNHYTLQVENFGAAINGSAAYPCPLEFSRGTQVMLDQIFAAA
jgi:predicted dehydrogenase